MSLRNVPAMLRPTIRAMRWQPFLGAAGLGLAIVTVPAATSVALTDQNLVTLLRLAAVCGGLGATFLLDDAATRSIATVPVGRLLRYAVRFGLALTAFAAWWAAVVAITVAGAEEGITATDLHPRGTTVEAAAVLAVALGLAVLAGRNAADGIGSTRAGAGLLLVMAGVALLPDEAALFVVPDDPRWRTVHGWWAILLAAVVVASAWTGREPLPHRRRTHRGHEPN